MISLLSESIIRSEVRLARAVIEGDRSRLAMLGMAAILLSTLGAHAVSAQPALTITPCSVSCLTGLPGGIAGHAYPLIHFEAAGGTAPYSWSATGLPRGLTLSGTGGLSGTPSSAGAFTATIKVTDSTTPTPLTASRDFIINISGNLTLALTAVPQGVVNLPLNGSITLQLEAVGGTPPYAWSLTSGVLPTGVTLSNTGVLAGNATASGVFTFAAQVRDSIGATAAQPISVTAGPLPSRAGILSQVATGGGWTTSLYLINNSPSPITLSVNFYKDAGTPLSLPVATTLPDGTAGPGGPNLAGLATQLDPFSTVLIQTTGQSDEETSGWADVLASAPLTGYGVFDYFSPGILQSEGTVPLVTSFQTTYELPYDNVNGVGTAVALTNLSSTTNTGVTVAVWDAHGNQLAAATINLEANGHTAFALTDIAPTATANRGIVRFRSNAAADIGGLGLRVSAAGGLTSIPQIATPD